MYGGRTARRVRNGTPATELAALPPFDQRRGRDAVVEAAAAVFMERGYAATSVDDVARRLGATKGRVYHYYRSKAQLFFEVHKAAMRLINEAVGPLAAAEMPPAEKLHAMALEHARVVMRHFAIEKVALQGLQRHLLRGDVARNRMMRRAIALRDGYEALFASVIREGIDEGVFKDVAPRLATKPVLGALNWLTIWFDPQQEDEYGVETIAQYMARFVVDGLRKERTP